MNAFAGAISNRNTQSMTVNRVFTRFFSIQFLWRVLLIFLILATAVSVVYTQNLHREYYSQLQIAKHKYDELLIERGQLLLEQSSWATQSRVQKIAQTQLNMKIPRADEIELAG